ncbi:MAG TPA: amino acid transporter, partial [Chloroflexota bacterium]|nr:amino acid transporter [Chloroflexota bacterium]
MKGTAQTDLGNWEPFSPDKVAQLFRDLTVPWWVGGGWAIDLFVGRQTRAHADIDVQILRRDQLAVRRQMAGWELYAADPPGTLRLWQGLETLV